MHRYRLPDAIERLPWTALDRLPERVSWAAKAWLACGLAVFAGFLIGVALIGPIVSAGSPDNAEAVAARFSPRTVDPSVSYPDPFPYRTATPDFGPEPAPTSGAYARQQAQSETGTRLPEPNVETFGLASSSGRYRTPDRHTGVSY
jgi:hypothetical protein